MSVNIASKQGSTVIVAVAYDVEYDQVPIENFVKVAVTLKVTISGLVVSYEITVVEPSIEIGLVDGVLPATCTSVTSMLSNVQSD